MSKRFKSAMPPRPFPATLGRGGQRRILKAGEPWLLVWREELKITWAELAKQSGLAISRIDGIERGADYPTDDEVEALARGLGTTVEAIKAVQV